MTLSAHRLSWIARIAAFENRRVAVLADLVADEFVHGDIARVSREAPVLVLDHRSTTRVPGGGGNSVANLRALGAKPLPVGVVGKDEAGKGLIAAFRERGISTRGIVRVPGYETPTKSRILAGGVHTRRQQIVRLDRGAQKGELAPALRKALRKALDQAIDNSEGLLVADYHYGSASPSWSLPAIRRWRKAGRIVTVDSRGRTPNFQGLTACTPNLEELENASGIEASADRARLTAAGKELLRQTGNEAVLATLGARGMALFQPRKTPAWIPAFGSEEVADVTGAGDTVIAAFTLALIAGSSPLEAAELANIAAGLVVQKAGTATVTPAELIAAIEEGESDAAS